MADGTDVYCMLHRMCACVRGSLIYALVCVWAEVLH